MLLQLGKDHVLQGSQLELIAAAQVHQLEPVTHQQPQGFGIVGPVVEEAPIRSQEIVFAEQPGQQPCVQSIRLGLFADYQLSFLMERPVLQPLDPVPALLQSGYDRARVPTAGRL